MSDYKTPLNIQSELCDRANAFNAKFLVGFPCRYMPDSRGKFTYLYRYWYDGSFEPVARLTYLGEINNMDFAVYDPKSERYVDSKKKFPFVQQFLDGTIEGAMKAGLIIYPISKM